MRFLLYVLLFFILFRLVGMVLRIFIGRSVRQNFENKKNSGSKVDVEKKTDKSSQGYKGGEYIDYEELD